MFYMLCFKPPPPRSKLSLLMNPSLPLKPIANSCFGQKKINFLLEKMEIIQFKWLLCPPVAKNMEKNEKKNLNFIIW